jgi:uncharacterized protein (TIGR03084 family)
LDVIDDLVAEQDRIEEILGRLDADAWLAGSGAPGWTIADVVLHLAQTEESVVASAQGKPLIDADAVAGATTMDEVMAKWVDAERTDPTTIFARWRTARRAAVDTLRATPTDQRLPWAAAPLRPQALATTRLAEHWAHALDITGPLGVPLPDTDRLRHIAWLAHRTLPYGFNLAGEEPHNVFVELTAPDGTTTWPFGSPDANSTISGPAGAFCRVGAQRLAAEDSGLRTTGPHGATALRVLRNYAG